MAFLVACKDEDRFENPPYATGGRDFFSEGDIMTYNEAYMMCWKLNMQQSSVTFLPKIPGLRPSSFRGKGKAKPNRRKEQILESEKQGSQLAKYLRR